MPKNNRFSDNVTVFRKYTLPETDMKLAGYSALIYRYDLEVPLPELLSAISEKHRRYTEGKWQVFRTVQEPDQTLLGHLTFAFRYEGIDLLILKNLFKEIEKTEIEAIVQDQPTGRNSRRIWFFYEWLIDERLDLEDAKSGNYVEALDTDLQYPGPKERSKRHRIWNNLPGNKDFCPLVRRTEKLENFSAENLESKVKDTIGKVHPDLLSRAAAFLLLKDSKASYAIEGETPPENRAERWGKAIGQAGQKDLTKDELLRLQEIVIEDRRFVDMGWRKEGGFVGIHNRVNSKPVPDHISAKWEDVPKLIDGLLNTNESLIESDYDPVLAATLIAFGFVFIHPFTDGNGRVHRYLIHHVLAKKEFAPKGLIFPVSSVILDQIDEYKEVLESYSKPRLDLIEWEATSDGNVEVLNDTIDLYRYFDATKQAEFLYECVEETVTDTLPEEVQYLERHDKMRTFISEHFDIPDKGMENLIGFLRQNDGTLSKRARTKEFEALTEDEVNMLEGKYQDIFSEGS
ncbi:cell filamentation protein Fic [Aliifodinibius salipaludis]|uniref:Cell filamentation protein Fic n=1 Tax=Fodinibius salipaludis TaxID=2032627 RepID=A0A2A2GDY5_9BACT|nr:Fic family protein [Aliifodinibius salipaludis]PAU94982.1 cell filamentation protein Fic [Aliifodinibius salipaludis]